MIQQEYKVMYRETGKYFFGAREGAPKKSEEFIRRKKLKAMIVSNKCSAE